MKKQCPYCDKYFTSQGLPGHIKLIHLSAEKQDDPSVETQENGLFSILFGCLGVIFIVIPIVISALSGKQTNPPFNSGNIPIDKRLWG